MSCICFALVSSTGAMLPSSPVLALSSRLCVSQRLSSASHHCKCNTVVPLFPPRLQRTFGNVAPASSPASSLPSSTSAPRPRPSSAPFQSGYWTAERRQLLKILSFSFPCMFASGYIMYTRCQPHTTATHQHRLTAFNVHNRTRYRQRLRWQEVTDPVTLSAFAFC